MNNTKSIERLELIKNIILNYELFVYAYVVTSILWFFPFLGPFMNPICKVEFVWGSFLLAYNFLFEKKVYKSKQFFLFLSFLLAYAITIFVNIRGQFYMGIKHLIYSAIAMMLIFNVMKSKDESAIKKYIFKLNNIVMVISMIASAISVLMYFFTVSIEMEYMGNYIRQGFIDHRLFGIYTSANTGATMAILTVAFMVINNHIQGKKLREWSKWYIVNFVVQLMYFSLTLSRGGQVTLYVFIATYMVAVVLPKHTQSKSFLRAVTKTICIFVVVCLVSVLGIKGIQKGSTLLANTISKITMSIKGEEINEDASEEDNEIRRIESGDDMSNGRFTIWSGGISVWKQSPLFGIADVRIDDAQLKCGIYDISNLSESEIDWLTKVEGNLHNSYVQILVNAGIVGSFFFLIIAVVVGIKYVKFLLDRNMQKSNIYGLVAMIFAMMTSMLANCCFENRILFDRQNPFGLLFWLYLGIGCTLIEYKTSKGEESKR